MVIDSTFCLEISCGALVLALIIVLMIKPKPSLISPVLEVRRRWKEAQEMENKKKPDNLP